MLSRIECPSCGEEFSNEYQVCPYCARTYLLKSLWRSFATGGCLLPLVGIVGQLAVPVGFVMMLMGFPLQGAIAICAGILAYGFVIRFSFRQFNQRRVGNGEPLGDEAVPPDEMP